MSYNSVYDSRTPQELGISFDSIIQSGARLLEGAGGSAGAAARVVQDPYFPELTCHIIRLSNIADGKPAGRCVKTRPGARGRAIGLKDAILPVKVLVAHKKRPWMVPLIAAGVLGTAVMIGYSLGKGK